MFDFRMETFLTVCKYMNYTRAANELNITQPAVSQHIRYLENLYDIALFEHEGKKIFLTKAGEILLNSAITMKHDEAHMRMRMTETQKGIQNYSFGATRTVAEFMIPDDLKCFIRNHPGSHISMEVANTRELLKKLDSSELDFAVVEGSFPKNEYDYLPYSTEEYIAAASPKIARKYKNKSVYDLMNETLLLRESGSGTREILENWLLQKGLSVSQFKNVIELGNIGTINYMLKAGLGITFCYHAAIKLEENAKKLSVIELKDTKLTHEVMFIFKKNSIFKDDYINIYNELCHH